MGVYVPRHFAMSDEAVRDLLTAAETADVVTPHVDGLHATFLPMLYDPEPRPYGRLLFHAQKNNPQVREAITGPGLVIVHGPDHYVSPAGLPSTREHGRGVPTWDYVTAHVRGEVVLHPDPDWTREAVRLLTHRHEGDNGWNPYAGGADGDGQAPVAPAAWVERLLPAIVGVELRITSWEGKAKMAQNKSVADITALADRLEAIGDREGAAYLREVSLPYARHRESLVEGVREDRRLGMRTGG